MNKKLFFVCLVFALVFTGMLTAKSIGLNLEAGAAYTNHQLHTFGKDTKSDGFKYQGIKSKSLFGVNLGISYPLPKNWAVFVNTTFAFNNTFVNDTMLGAGYIFKPTRGVDLFLGGGLALGGSVFKWAKGSVSTTYKFFNIGAGINFTASVMFTNKIGMYAGISDIRKRKGFENTSLSMAAIEKLMSMPWHGNVRELKNVVERAAILSQGGEIPAEHLVPGTREFYISNAAKKKPLKPAVNKEAEKDRVLPEDIKPFDEAQTEIIQKALSASNGKIYGKDGAAALLNLKPGTLQSKMKKLGIKY